MSFIFSKVDHFRVWFHDCVIRRDAIYGTTHKNGFLTLQLMKLNGDILILKSEIADQNEMMFFENLLFLNDYTFAARLCQTNLLQMYDFSNSIILKIRDIELPILPNQIMYPDSIQSDDRTGAIFLIMNNRIFILNETKFKDIGIESTSIRIIEGRLYSIFSNELTIYEIESDHYHELKPLVIIPFTDPSVDSFSVGSNILDVNLDYIAIRRYYSDQKNSVDVISLKTLKCYYSHTVNGVVVNCHVLHTGQLFIKSSFLSDQNICKESYYIYDPQAGEIISPYDPEDVIHSPYSRFFVKDGGNRLKILYY